LLQYGGAGRPASLSDLFNGFFNPSRYDNTGADLSFNQQFGNQQASITSTFLFPGKVPFAVYAEYAGEDTSHGRSYLLRNSALTVGIHFPRIFQRPRFAKGAITFEHAYANGNFTTLGVASIVTGTRPWTHRALQLPSWPLMGARRVSLPALLSRAGYVTGYVSTNPPAGVTKNGMSNYFDYASRDRTRDISLCNERLSSLLKYACAARGGRNSGSEPAAEALVVMRGSTAALSNAVHPPPDAPIIAMSVKRPCANAVLSAMITGSMKYLNGLGRVLKIA
jgi:hypothetical protein